jgi:flavodoxin
MKILVVYDSIFGNTKRVAEAIGNSFDDDEVEVVHVNDVEMKRLKYVELLIVGSPTRQFKPTEGIENFLGNIPADWLKGAKVMAFDTRMSKMESMSKVLKIFVKMFGYAAEPIGNKLVKKGGKLLCSPEGFFVKGSKGPLHDGECERAAAWAESAIEDSVQ